MISKILRSITILLILSCFMQDAAWSQRHYVTSAGAIHHTYNIEDGLPSAFPTNVFRSNEGYFWYSSIDGIARITADQILDFGNDYDVHLMSYVYYDSKRSITWFSDAENLVRYDGSSIKRFTDEDGFLVPGSARKTVSSIFTDSKERTWIGSVVPTMPTTFSGGLLVMENGSFTEVSRDELPLHNISGVIETYDGSVWFTSSGYTSERRFSDESWLARLTEDGFIVYNGEDDCKNVLTGVLPDYGLVPLIVSAGDGTIILSCAGSIDSMTRQRQGNGVFVFRDGEFTRLDHPALRADLMNYFPKNNTMTGEVIISHSLHNFFADLSGLKMIDLLIYSDGDWRVETIAERSVADRHFREFISSETAINYGVEVSILQDGSLMANLIYYDPLSEITYSVVYRRTQNGWEYFDTIAGFIIAQLGEDTYITLNNNVAIYGLYSSPSSRLYTGDDGLPTIPDEGLRMLTDSDGDVWISGLDTWNADQSVWDANGIYLWDGSRFSRFTVSDGLATDRKGFLHEDRNGLIWAPGDGGVSRIIKRDGDFFIESFYGSGGNAIFPTRMMEVSNGEMYAYRQNVNALMIQSDINKPFFGKFNGKEFETVSIFPDSILNKAFQEYWMLEMPDGTLMATARVASTESQFMNAPSILRVLSEGQWVEAPERWDVPNMRLFPVGAVKDRYIFIVNDGIFEFNGNRFVNLSDSVNARSDFRIFQRVNTLNTRFDIQGKDHVYIRFRNRGLAVFDGDQITYFDSRNGLTSPEIIYPNMLPDGRVVFATPTGAMIFNGTEFQSVRDVVGQTGMARGVTLDKHGNVLILYSGHGLSVTRIDNTPHPMVLTDVFAGRPIYDLRSAHTFGPDTRDIRFQFASLNFANPGEVLYTYFLDGHDLQWSRPMKVNSAEYRGLSPGTYTMNIRAINPGDILSDVVQFTFTIRPPWYATIWAYILYIVIFGGFVFLGGRTYQQLLLKKEREAARERELEQAKAIEKAFHDLEKAHEHLKAAQTQLIQQEKLASLGQLTAGIAHEIKNPLNFVNNFSLVSVELIDEAIGEVNSLPPSDTSAEIVDLLGDIKGNLTKIHEHGSRADRIVKSMLLHSRGGSGKREPADVNALLREYVNLAFHGMRAGKNPIDVEVDLDLDDSVGEIPLVADDFSRVILNLCNNGFDAMREGAVDKPGRHRLSVSSRVEGDRVVIEVRDNGPGVPAEFRDRILQPFFTTKKGTEGTGLGLSISHDIIKAHGGELTIDDADGGGAVFRISLPAIAPNKD